MDDYKLYVNYTRVGDNRLYGFVVHADEKELCYLHAIPIIRRLGGFIHSYGKKGGIEYHAESYGR